MHPNPAYRTQPETDSIAFAQGEGFGHLTTNANPFPLISHIPFILNDRGTVAEFHLVRSNPMARLLNDRPMARLAVTGPHGYVSPDWYGIEDQVPTWNYIAVHLSGRLEPMPEQSLPELLDRQSAFFEHKLLPKPIWQTAKMTPDVLNRMLRQIVPVRMIIKDLQSTWKLSQNKPVHVRLTAAQNVAMSKIGSETKKLSKKMQQASD